MAEKTPTIENLKRERDDVLRLIAELKKHDDSYADRDTVYMVFKSVFEALYTREQDLRIEIEMKR